MANEAPQHRRGSASLRSASQRKPLVAANWKMHKTTAETADFFERFVGDLGGLEAVEIAIAPPFTSLPAAVDHARRSPVLVVAQNVHEAEQGAFTGEVSIPILADLGVAGAIVGHSERRQLFCETDETVARKLPALLGAEMLAILCVGETESERDADRTEDVLRRQFEADLAAVDDADLGRLVIAYEPIWAIGTGRTATPEQAQEAIGFIRELVAARDARAGAAVRILYGGSVKPDNAAELFSRPEIDGGLVGGASLDPGDFRAICEGALS
jgi:triosephosphate isomerase